MSDKQMLLCEHKKGKVVLNTDEYDGDYVFIVNRAEDFSLYTLPAFDKVKEIIAAAANNDRQSMLVARYVFGRVCLVSISEGKLDVPMKSWLELKSEKLEAQVFPDHIRFTAIGKNEILEEKKDIIEMILGNMSV